MYNIPLRRMCSLSANWSVSQVCAVLSAVFSAVLSVQYHIEKTGQCANSSDSSTGVSLSMCLCVNSSTPLQMDQSHIVHQLYFKYLRSFCNKMLKVNPSWRSTWFTVHQQDCEGTSWFPDIHPGHRQDKIRWTILAHIPTMTSCSCLNLCNALANMFQLLFSQLTQYHFHQHTLNGPTGMDKDMSFFHPGLLIKSFTNCYISIT